MLKKLYENLLLALGIENKKATVTKKRIYNNKNFATQPIELHNSNVVYPSNKTQLEIEKLYEEIREMQANSNVTAKYRYHAPRRY